MENLQNEVGKLNRHRLYKYQSHCDIIRHCVHEKLDISIESCKAILEGLSKLTIHLLTQEPISRLNSFNFDQLFKLTLTEFDKKGGDQFYFHTDTVRRFGSAVGHLGEIGNHHGDISQGRASLKQQVSDADLTEMVAGITDHLGTYILRKLKRLEQLKTEDEDEYDANVDFNQYIDDSYPMEGDLSYSKALIDQDHVVYQQRLGNWLVSFNPES